MSEKGLHVRREDTYFEIDVDIGSSYAASSVVNLVKGATKSMVIDFGVLVEGKAEDELPERLIGALGLRAATLYGHSVHIFAHFALQARAGRFFVSSKDPHPLHHLKNANDRG